MKNPFELIDDRLNNIESLLHDLNKKPKENPLPKEQIWLTRKETIDLLKVSYVTLNSWNRTGILTAYKIANRVRYKKTDIESALIKMR